MKIRAIVTASLFSAFSIAFSSPGLTQTAVGGATKTKQNTVGGIAKPAPALGGAVAPASVGTKPATAGNAIKPGPVVGTPTAGSTGNATATGASGNAAAQGAAASAARQNLAATAPNKGKTVVGTTSNLKCGGGACVVRGAKP
jgi:hypothetical protein